MPLKVEHIYGASTRVGQVWVAYASGNLCVFAGSPLAISCSPINHAERAGVLLGLIKQPKSGGGPHSDRRFIVYGVMPDSKSNLTLEVGHRRIRLRLGQTGLFGLQARWPITEPRR